MQSAADPCSHLPQDFDMSPFECARKLLDGSQAALGLGAKMDLVFQDMDLVPLLIQENYVNHKPNLGVAEEQHMRVRQPMTPLASWRMPPICR